MLLQQMKQFLLAEDGTTAVEYGVMLAMILVVIIVSITATGQGVAGWWADTDTELQSNGF